MIQRREKNIPNYVLSPKTFFPLSDLLQSPKLFCPFAHLRGKGIAQIAEKAQQGGAEVLSPAQKSFCSLILLHRIELYSPIVHDLRVGWPSLCSRFQVAPPGNEERLIQTYAVGSRPSWNLKAVRIAIGMPGDLIDIEVFRIRISRMVRISSSVEIQVGDRSNGICYICSVYAEVGVCCLSCGYMVNAINDYEIIGIVAQSNL